MVVGRQTERRQARHAALALEHSFLFRISPRLAWVITIVVLGAVAAIEFYSPTKIWFGPIYLAVIALAAWSLSSRIAVLLGLLILSTKIATGGLSFYPYGSELALSNLALRVFGILIVIGFIGIARKACEREWWLARTDPLTGALNRQAFFEIIKSDQCSGGWSAIIYADLDGLKRLNDEEGHDRGDLSLKLFSETVKNTVRKGDVFARMGGDEFVIFMKLKDQQAGEAVARRLHQAINVDGSGSAFHLKCSLGVLLLPDGSKSIDAELRAADEIMYEAKKTRSGVFISTAVERNGKIALSPRISVVGATSHDSSVRKTGRGKGAAENPSSENFQRPALALRVSR